MNVIVQFTKDEEARAIPILFCHSPGTILPNRTYVIELAAAQALRDSGIEFRPIAPAVNTRNGGRPLV